MGADKPARARYRAPIMRRRTPYLRGLFPDVEMTLDDDLRFTSLTRRVEAEAMALLSDGTREQVAVLLRLAYAEMLRERGKPAMLILDDALAYIDPEHCELMFDLLTNAPMPRPACRYSYSPAEPTPFSGWAAPGSRLSLFE